MESVSFGDFIASREYIEKYIAFTGVDEETIHSIIKHHYCNGKKVKKITFPVRKLEFYGAGGRVELSLSDEIKEMKIEFDEKT